MHAGKTMIGKLALILGLILNAAAVSLAQDEKPLRSEVIQPIRNDSFNKNGTCRVRKQGGNPRTVNGVLATNTSRFLFTPNVCVEQAFHQARETFEAMFGQQLSVDTLERVSRRMGAEAGDFLNALPASDSAKEGQFLGRPSQPLPPN